MTNIIILFSRSKSLQIIGVEVEIPIAILLHQHSTRGNKQSIGHDEEREVSVRIIEDGTL